MPRHARTLRILKWTGTLGCLLLATLFVGSGWQWVVCDGSVGEPWLQCGVRQGILSFAALNKRPFGFPPGTRFWLLDPSAYPASGSEPRFVWWPGSLLRASPGYWHIYIPLWLPLVALLPPTLWLWHRDRRRPRPGYCRRCDYDLTGNVSGVCPECGTPIPRRAA
jgi:hypothetical protein